MRKLIERAFVRTVEFFPREFRIMPLDRWSEAVFRYHFCRFLSLAHPKVTQHVECSRIDLVLRRPGETAFVEFKFYGHPPKFNPYTGKRRGFKGGPGKKNLSEFRKCINELAHRRSGPGVTKYVVLFYADPEGTLDRKHSFSSYYEDYKHPNRTITLQRLDKRSLQAGQHLIGCRLYEICSPDRASPRLPGDLDKSERS